MSRSTTRHGPSSRRALRKSRMRSVIGAISSPRAAPPPDEPWVDRADSASRRRRSTRLLPWSGTGDPDPHARQGRTSLFGDRQRSVVTKKARSVVALSRVPRGERGAPVSPPAAGRGCKEAGSSLGGCPASCPDAHRPTHGHRHVRNWAITHLSYPDIQRKRFGRDSRANPL